MEPTQTPSPTLSLCVYCGSRHGSRADYRSATQALGTQIGQRGWQLVYGGGKVGLMGEVADSALAAGARVVGVIPERLDKLEVAHRGLHELHVVATMHQRKQMMAERAHAFVALPGGIGTLEELYEVWTWRQLGYHNNPIGLLDTAGYWQPLLRLMEHTVAEGFVSAEMRDVVIVEADPARLLDRIAAAARLSAGGDDYSRT